MQVGQIGPELRQRRPEGGRRIAGAYVVAVRKNPPPVLFPLAGAGAVRQGDRMSAPPQFARGVAEIGFGARLRAEAVMHEEDFHGEYRRGTNARH